MSDDSLSSFFVYIDTNHHRGSPAHTVASKEPTSVLVIDSWKNSVTSSLLSYSIELLELRYCISDMVGGIN